MDEMKTDNTRPLPLIEMTTHCVAYLLPQAVQIVGLRKDGGAEGARRVTTFGGVLNQKD